MYEKIIDEIQIQANRVKDVQRSAIDALQKLKDPAGNIIGVAVPISEGDRTISDLDTLASTLVKFSEGFRSEKNWSFVPRGWLNEYSEALKNTANSFESLNANIAAIDAQHGGLAAIDAATFMIGTKNNTPIDVRKILGAIGLNVDKAFEAYYRLRPAISAPRLTEFGELFNIFSTRKTELDSLSKELSSLAQRGDADFKSLKAASDIAKTMQAEVTRVREAAESDRKSSGEFANESSQRLETIKAIQKNAEELNAAVNNYQAAFNQFQSQLESRNGTYESQKSEFERLKNLIDSQEKEVGRQIKNAEDMLKGATNAGLAGSYSSKQISTDSELRKARLAYYVSIALLVFLTLPIFLYSLPREFISELWRVLFHTTAPALVAAQAPQTFQEHVINLAGRAVFLIPGLMFVRFASARHSQLFRLREDYAYKYSIAASVEGFMKQAQSYADDIAFSSYLQLTYNPAEKMDHKSTDSELPNPLWEKFISKIEGLPLKKRVAPGAK